MAKEKTKKSKFPPDKRYNFKLYFRSKATCDWLPSVITSFDTRREAEKHARRTRIRYWKIEKIPVKSEIPLVTEYGASFSAFLANAGITATDIPNKLEILAKNLEDAADKVRSVLNMSKGFEN